MTDDREEKRPLYVTMDRPITIRELCRCLVALLIGVSWGAALFVLGANLVDTKEPDAATATFCFITAIVAGAVAFPSAPALFAVGAGILLPLLPLALIFPVENLLPCICAALFLAAGTTMLIRYRRWNPGTTGEPTTGQRLCSAAFGVVAGLVLYWLLLMRGTGLENTHELASSRGGIGLYSLQGAIAVGLFAVGVTMLAFCVTAMSSTLGVIIMALTCLIAAMVSKPVGHNYVGALVIGAAALAASISLHSSDSLEPPTITVQATSG